MVEDEAGGGGGGGAAAGGGGGLDGGAGRHGWWGCSWRPLQTAASAAPAPPAAAAAGCCQAVRPSPLAQVRHNHRHLTKHRDSTNQQNRRTVLKRPTYEPSIDFPHSLMTNQMPNIHKPSTQTVGRE